MKNTRGKESTWPRQELIVKVRFGSMKARIIMHFYHVQISPDGRFLSPEAEFLDEIQTKVLGVFLLLIHSFVLRFIFLQTHATT